MTYFKIFIALLFFTCCNKLEDEKLDLFNREDFNLEILETYVSSSKKKKIKLSKEKGTLLYGSLEKNYTKTLFRGREYTDYTLKSIVFHIGVDKYKLIINKTTDNKISINYFKFKKTNFQKFYGRNFINIDSWTKIENIIE